jgi:two-component system response regulator AtoC
LNVVPIRIPPLRDRREDIRPLADHLLGRISNRLGGEVRSITPDGMKALLSYQWPGNVRELENILERAAILSGTAQLDEEHITPLLLGEGLSGPEEEGSEDLSIKRSVKELEKRLIIKALQQTRHNRSQAARLLEISHRALLYKIKDYGIDVPGR